MAASCAQARLIAAIMAGDMTQLVRALEDGAQPLHDSSGNPCSPGQSVVALAVRTTLMEGDHTFIHGFASKGYCVEPALAASFDLTRDYGAVKWNSRVMEVFLRYWPGDRAAYWNSPLNPNGETLMHIMAQKGRQACVEVMLRLGLDPNVRTGRGRTPLHVANSSSTIATLIQGGADIRALDNARMSPLAMAARKLREASLARASKKARANTMDAACLVLELLEHRPLDQDPRAGAVARMILRALNVPGNIPNSMQATLEEHAQLGLAWERRQKLGRHAQQANKEVRTGRRM